jgi:hypothetical protein
MTFHSGAVRKRGGRDLVAARSCLPALTSIQPQNFFPRKSISSDSKNLAPAYIGEYVPWLKPYSTKDNPANYFRLGRQFITYTELEHCYQFSSVLLEQRGIISLIEAIKNDVLDVLDLKLCLALIETRKRREFSNKIGRVQWRELYPLMPKKIHGVGKVTKELLQKRFEKLKSLSFIHLRDFPRVAREDYAKIVRDTLGQKYPDKKIWVPRRLLKFLVKSANLSQILTAFTLLLRRMPYRFFRSRVSCTLIHELTGISRTAAQKALKWLETKKIITPATQANKHWVVWHSGKAYNLCSDLTLPTHSRRQAKRKRFYPKPELPHKTQKPYKHYACEALGLPPNLWDTTILLQRFQTHEARVSHAIRTYQGRPLLSKTRALLQKTKLVYAEKQLPYSYQSSSYSSPTDTQPKPSSRAIYSGDIPLAKALGPYKQAPNEDLFRRKTTEDRKRLLAEQARAVACGTKEEAAVFKEPVVMRGMVDLKARAVAEGIALESKADKVEERRRLLLEQAKRLAQEGK